jgi:hypothetical protein
VEEEADTDPDALRLEDGVVIIDKPPVLDSTEHLIVTFRPQPTNVTIHLPRPRPFPRATRPPTDER